MPISHRHTPLEYPNYIPLMPWQQVAEVGQKKELDYVTGVKSVQNNIDSFASLPMTRDVARNYLRQRVDELTSLSNKYAGEDFSNSDVVSQISRLGAPIAKDPYIINEIKSTNELARRQETLKGLKPDQRSAANDWYFMKDYNSWIKSNDLNQTLNYKEYKPYEDLSKKWSEIYKELKDKGEISSSYETPTGNGYIVSTKESGLDSQRLSQAFLSSLTASEREQLYIDATYDLSLKSPDTAYNTFVDHYSNVANVADERISQLQNEVVKQRNLVASSGDPLAKKTLLSLESQLQEANIAAKVARNKMHTYTPYNLPEGEYIDMYTNRFVDNLANAYQYRQVEQSIKSDPTWIARYHESNANYRSQLDRESAERIAANKVTAEKQDAETKAELSKLDKLVPLYKGDLDQSNNNFFNPQDIQSVKNIIASGDFTNGRGQSGNNTLDDLLGRFTKVNSKGVVENQKFALQDDQAFASTFIRGNVTPDGALYSPPSEGEAAPLRYKNFREKIFNIAKSLNEIKDPNQEVVVVFRQNGQRSVVHTTKKNLLEKKNGATLLPEIEEIYDPTQTYKPDAETPYIPSTVYKPE